MRKNLAVIWAHVDAVCWWLAKLTPGIVMVAFIYSYAFTPYMRKA